MIVLSGASASGKTEAAKMLMTKHGIKRAITTTTRPMRSQEVDGRDYFREQRNFENSQMALLWNTRFIMVIIMVHQN